MTTEATWGELRSNVYIRDKGICWVCNCFVKLEDYDLGHLIDRCNGGHDDYDNLAVMHKSCNLSKPFHQTLEEAVKWRMTAFIPAIKEARGISTYSRPKRIKRMPRLNREQKERIKIAYINSHNSHKKNSKKSNRITKRQQENYNDQVAKIKPATIVWIQGSPQGGTMWRVLPPPYRQEDIFVMRQTPPGATHYDEYSDINDTLQVIGGELPNDFYADLNSGIVNYRISFDNGKLSITYKSSSKSNIGERSQTIGMGNGQIPIKEWNQAKRNGIRLDTFKAAYLNKA